MFVYTPSDIVGLVIWGPIVIGICLVGILHVLCVIGKKVNKAFEKWILR